jgi:helicase MOV-10
MKVSRLIIKLIHLNSVVKLTKNFRSHKAILKFPNDNFYRSELEQCGSPKVINSYIGSPILISPKFPVIFHVLSGKDDREATSPSFFNIDEVSQVKRYIQTLRSDRRNRISWSLRIFDINLLTSL